MRLTTTLLCLLGSLCLASFACLGPLGLLSEEQGCLGLTSGQLPPVQRDGHFALWASGVK